MKFSILVLTLLVSTNLLAKETLETSCYDGLVATSVFNHLNEDSWDCALLEKGIKEQVSQICDSLHIFSNSVLPTPMFSEFLNYQATVDESYKAYQAMRGTYDGRVHYDNYRKQDRDWFIFGSKSKVFEIIDSLESATYNCNPQR